MTDILYFVRTQKIGLNGTSLFLNFDAHSTNDKLIYFQISSITI